MRNWLRGRRSGPATPSLVGAVVGDLAGPSAVVDEYGRVAAVDGSWTVEWGAGAEDRWHIAHDEVAVRQSRLDDAPAYETRMRVPSGDVVARVAATNDGTSRALVMEFENASPGPLAVAVVGRVAYRGRLAAAVDGVAIDRVDWLVPERPAAAVWAGAADPWAAVIAEPHDREAEIEAAEPAGALVLTLPHRQRVGLVVMIDGDPPARIPRPDDVAAGWRRLTDDALSIEVPDTDLGEAWRRILPDLVVQAGSADGRAAAEAAPLLEVAGLPEEAGRARATVIAVLEDGGLADDDLVWAWRALAGHGLLVEADERRMAERQGATPPTPVTPAAVAAARVLAAVIDDAGAGEVRLLPAVPPEWVGRPVDVRRVGTAGGRVSFSVRWHGERPALLWERDGGDEGVRLTCPGLDPDWSTTERSGEALLAAPAG